LHTVVYFVLKETAWIIEKQKQTRMVK